MGNNKGYKILIVDDDPTLCLIASKKLSQQGYQVITTGLGKEGIQIVLDYAPDLLLLDYELPDMTGVEVCQEIRSHSANIEVPILFITGKNDYESIEYAFQAGATDFSSKPLNWTILSYRIQYMLRAHETYLSLLSSEIRLTNAQKVAKIANWEYNSVEKSFKWSETIFDILEIESQHRNNFGFPDFLARVPADDAKRIQQAIDNCLNNHINFELEHELITPNENKKVICHLGKSITNTDSTKHVNYIGTLQDVTERHTSENKIRNLAYYDSLTGLMNRESFLTALDRILISNKKYHLLSALLFIDLDDFKRVNDTLGHNLGDLLLCEVAERLKECVRTAEQEEEYQTENSRQINNIFSDSVFRINSLDINRFDLGRLGGDEFTVFLADIGHQDVAASIAKRLLKALEKSFFLDGHEVYLTFSVGISISPTDGECIETLLKNADIAMYSAKEAGKNHFQFYTPQMNESSLYRLTMESDLRNAISKDELRLVYQPQFCFKTNRLVGAEALMRWNHKTLGEIPPLEFIPLAEQTGQILTLGKWLFEHLSIALHYWKQQQLIPEQFKLALNVSSMQFHQANMLSMVGEFFSDPELNKHVEFELTESVMMKNSATNLEKLNLLVEENITLSIDDFGTGFSSLSYLHRFPVHTVKIDRSFISNMEDDGQVNIVKAIIAMGHGMDIKVIAEGIENQWQYDFLKAEGCDIGQGFFLAKPLSKEIFQQLLQSESLKGTSINS